MLLRTEFAYLLAALRFLTRLPTPASPVTTAEELSHATRYMPLVGIIVGFIGALVTWAAAWVLPLSLAIVFGMVATVLATGALHEDGWADSCDGFGGGWNKEQVLTIMKDSRIGSYGALGLGLMVLAKWNALYELDDDLILPGLIAAHAVSRFASVAVMFALDYVRGEDSKSGAAATRPTVGELTLAAIFGLAPCLLLPWQWVAMGLGVAIALTLLAVRYFKRRIGGYTGDCLGAVQQITELGFYCGLLCVFI